LCRRGRRGRSRRAGPVAVGAPAAAGSALAGAIAACQAWSVKSRIAPTGMAATATAVVVGSGSPIGSQRRADGVFESGFVIVWSPPSIVLSAGCGLRCRREPARGLAVDAPGRISRCPRDRYRCACPESVDLRARALPLCPSRGGCSVPVRGGRAVPVQAVSLCLPGVLLPALPWAPQCLGWCFRVHHEDASAGVLRCLA
jgi:hypothetical protein